MFARVRKARTSQDEPIREPTARGFHDQMPGMRQDKDIARRLTAVREHFNLNQAEFAAKLNIAKNTLNGFERGSRPLTLETARRIRNRFGVSLDWLLFGDIGQPRQDLAEQLGPDPETAANRPTAEKPRKGR